MHGYKVVTSDDHAVGEVVEVQDGYLIVESGHLKKTRHPVPREFIHPVDEMGKVFVTVPKRVLMDAPRVRGDGEFDHDKAARWFGLAESYVQPPTGGGGVSTSHDAAQVDQGTVDAEIERAEIRQGLS